MSIQQEKEHIGIRDSQLMSGLLGFAKPYWRMILLCICLAALIVVADLARPYLLKLTIDENINGLTKPMVAVPVEAGGLVDRYGKKFVVDGTAFARISAKEAGSLAVPTGAEKRQIIDIGGHHYMINGWILSQKDKPALEVQGGRQVIHVGSAVYEAMELDAVKIKQFRQHDFIGLLQLGLLFLCAVLFGSILNYVQSNLLQYTGQNIIFNIRQKLFRHLSVMHMQFFDRNPVGRLVVRVTQDTESLNQLYSQVIVNLLKDVITLIGIIAIMLHMSVKLSMLAFVVLPLLALLTFWYRITIRSMQRKTRLLLSRINAFLAENLSGIRITQLFIREQRQLEQFDKLNQDLYRTGMRGTAVNSMFQPAIGFLGNLAVAMLLWYGGIHVIEGSVTFGVVYAFTHYIRQFFQPLQSLAEKYNQIQTAMVGAERIFDMLGEKPLIVDKPETKALPSYVRGEIEFQNVWFAYIDEQWVLKDVSFKIQPGQTIAFVGATGAGKSSIIQLINRFYDIQKGSIKLDGIDIRDIPLDQLRRYISVVQQDVFLFNGDFASNIRLNDTTISDAAVEKAAGMVHIDEFIRKEPNGYKTLLGERGITLSQGQRQLLSFARAIAFRPQILILDEATSNIDTETEMVVQDALNAISKGRTTVIVAHRLSTIQHADQIIVMHKGKVRETGNHFQLLAQRGYYYRLFELQYKEQNKVMPAR